MELWLWLCIVPVCGILRLLEYLKVFFDMSYTCIINF